MYVSSRNTYGLFLVVSLSYLALYYNLFQFVLLGLINASGTVPYFACSEIIVDK